MNNTLDNELRELETQLANLCPRQMPTDMLSRMEQAMISWETHLPVEEKIVPFSANETNHQTTSKQSNLQVWGAAAAIALMAGIAAVFSTGSNLPAPVTVQQPVKTSAVPVDDRVAVNTLPELSRNITHASNEGITFAGKNEAPFKVLRVEYTEKIISHDKDGNLVVTEKPCVEHVLIPIPVH